MVVELEEMVLVDVGIIVEVVEIIVMVEDVELMVEEESDFMVVVVFGEGIVDCLMVKV